ncbi:MAG: HAD-IA family hydrolase [Clostridia bacterium]|nr:HAD-IA family hydrolase [Clostridia bacterium]
MKYKNYIWDFDGTLYDSYPHIYAALCLVMDEEGMTQQFDMEVVRKYLQVSFAEMRKYTKMADEPYERFNALHHMTADSQIAPPIEPFADAETILSKIIEQGGRNYIYTHRNSTLYYYLDKFDLTKYFTDIMTAEEGFPWKPAPDALLALIARNGLEPSECIMIGDREIDGRAGKNAGIAGALVNYPDSLPDGTSPAEVSEMDYVAKTLSDFAEMMGII